MQQQMLEICEFALSVRLSCVGLDLHDCSSGVFLWGMCSL